MALIRALTFFIPTKSYDHVEKFIEKNVNKVENILDDLMLNPWTIRIVLPPLPKNLNVKEIEKIIYNLEGKNDQRRWIYNPIAIESDSKCMDYIIELLTGYEKTFATIKYKETRLDSVIEKIYMNDVDPDMFTRISLTYGDWVQTPYFPSTTNVKNVFGFSIALRYIDLFSEYINGVEENLINYLRKIENQILKYDDLYLGIDYSLSPWMEESVASVIENYYNIKLGDVGSFNAVNSINDFITSLIKRVGSRAIGFNEVMLPVGEDNILKERVNEGRINLPFLIGLASVCVAGLDMVAITKNKDYIEKLLLDMDKIQRVKRRSIGVRIIPIEGTEGKILSKRFGYIPIIK